MIVEQLLKQNEISARAYMVCKRNNLSHLKDIVTYYNKFKTFHNLSRCGVKTSKELITLSEKHNINPPIPQKGLMQKKIEALNAKQYEAVENLIAVEMQNLSIRAQNGLSSIFNGHINLKRIAQSQLFSENHTFLSVKNVGRKSASELDIFVEKIKQLIAEISQQKSIEKLNILNDKLFLYQLFKLKEVPQGIIEKKSIFFIVHFLLQQNALYLPKETKIIKNELHIYQNQKEITDIKLTNERIRQIKHKTFDQLFDKLKFITYFEKHLNPQFEIDQKANYIKLSPETIQRINEDIAPHFTKSFIQYILYVYLHKSHFLLGSHITLLSRKKVNFNKFEHRWKSFYMIARELCVEKELLALVNDLKQKFNTKIPETYLIDIETYLSSFLSKKSMQNIAILLPIVKEVIATEFGLHSIENNNIKIKRNTYKATYKYAFKALDVLGKPSRVERITQKVNELNKGYNADVQQIRVSMKKEFGFVSIGKTGVFGLKKWEEEIKGFKGGTIRRIIVDFLKTKKNPQDKKTIEAYVLQYRPTTNIKNIYYNLRMESTGIFSFFHKGLIGLKAKKYDSQFEEIKEMRRQKTWEIRFQEVQQFIEKEQRLPKCTKVTDEEIKLYRWLNVQKGNIKKKQLSPEKTRLYQALLKPFSTK